MNRDTKIGLSMIVVALVLSVGLGFFFGNLTAPKSPRASMASEGAFPLTLLEPMNSGWNTTLAQPQFYVVGANGLSSSSNISVPSGTLVELTIVSYDTPTPGSTDDQGKVSGTVGGTVYLINGTQASMGSSPMPWGQNVTSVPGSSLAHTFTITQLGINIPVVGGDSEVAYLRFDKPGTYTWLCLTPCGFGDNGAEGAMSTAGWMTGTITIT